MSDDLDEEVNDCIDWIDWLWYTRRCNEIDEEMQHHSVRMKVHWPSATLYEYLVTVVTELGLDWQVRIARKQQNENHNHFSENHLYEPQLVNFGTKIVDIACNYYHNWAVDESGKICSWGINDYGQCGQPEQEYENIIKQPTLITDLMDYKVQQIKCSQTHNYVRTECAKHFMFGQNRGYECLWFNSDNYKGYECVWKPHQIDKIVKEQTGGDIIDVFVGYYSTTILVSQLEE